MVDKMYSFGLLDSSVLYRDDSDFDEPDVKMASGEYGEFILVGHGERTRFDCGRFVRWDGCTHVEKHNKVIFGKDGVAVDMSGKGDFHPIFDYCDKPSCPVCYERGWAMREAGSIEDRLAESRKHFGDAEHIVISVPVKDFGLDFGVLRRKISSVLRSRGVIGGVHIFHGFRYERVRGWFWSPHFHVLGHVVGGVARCRHCKLDCNKRLCDGFYARCARGFGFVDKVGEVKGDGYVVHVEDKRKSIFWTAWYQLNHASIKKNCDRFIVAVWFGVCSYSKLIFTPELRKSFCRICGDELSEVVLSDCSCGNPFEGITQPFYDSILDSGGSVKWVQLKG